MHSLSASILRVHGTVHFFPLLSPSHITTPHLTSPHYLIHSFLISLPLLLIQLVHRMSTPTSPPSEQSITQPWRDPVRQQAPKTHKSLTSLFPVEVVRASHSTSYLHGNWTTCLGSLVLSSYGNTGTDNTMRIVPVPTCGWCWYKWVVLVREGEQEKRFHIILSCTYK